MNIAHAKEMSHATQYTHNIVEGGVPDYARKVSFVDRMTPVAFADQLHHRYPTYDKATTWQSYAAAKIASESEDILSEIKKAAAAYGIGEDIDKIEAGFKSQEVEASKKASEEPTRTAWALPAESRYPIHNPLAISTSAQKLASASGRSKLSVDQQLTAFRNICDNAQYFKMAQGEIPPEIVKQAEARYAEPAILRGQMDARINLANQKFAAVYEGIKSISEESPFQDEETLKKVAELIHDTDKAANLDTQWGRHLRFPLDVVFAGKTVSAHKKEAGFITVLAGNPIKVEAIADIPADHLADNFRLSTVSKVAALLGAVGDYAAVQEITNTIPEADQATLFRLASRHANRG